MEIQGKSTIKISRHPSGVPHVQCDNKADLVKGLGYCHAKDRGLQMIMTRILVRGTATQYLDDNPELLEIDKFFRRMNWHSRVEEELTLLDKGERALLKAYCEGANEAFAKHQPWELKWLLGFKDFRWSEADTLLMARMTGYLTLAQSQAEIELFLMQLVQKGVSREKLEELFPGQLGGLDIELLKKVKLVDHIVPESVKFHAGLSPSMASNNWVIAPHKTMSGKALLANDPHLETNRIPPVWYEFSAKMGDRNFFSATMPGLAGLLIGRNDTLAWGATYTFVDAVDYWIEEVKDGKYRRGDQWLEFEKREETIQRKKNGPLHLTFYHNAHGVLLGDPSEDGFYLTFAWSAGIFGGKTLKNAIKMVDATTAKQGMEYMGNYEMSFSWVVADAEGNIGFQMSGLAPKRREGVSGLAPLPGWDPANDWQGFLAPEELPRAYNPESGFIITANNDLNHLCESNPINMPMGSYRADRIEKLLKQDRKFGVEETKAMHYDVVSEQAKLFMPLIEPHLPDTEAGTLLRNWDFQYDKDSKGAYLFEMVYRSLYAEVFGPSWGKDWAAFLQNETGIFIDFYQNFDRILMKESSEWFGGRSREEMYAAAVEKGLSQPIKTWGEFNQISMNHILVGGKFPKFLGLDKGPFPLPGGRATIRQGQLYRAAGRDTSFTPSFRMIVDFAEKGVHTNSAGGVTDRPFTKFYFNDFRNWLEGVYKYVE